MGPLLIDAGDVIGGAWIRGTIAAVIAILVILQVLAAIARRSQSRPQTPRGLCAEARKLARHGEHARAGELFRAGGDFDQAVEQFRLAGLPHKAAEVLEARGHFGQAASLYERSQMWEHAAGAYVRAGDLKRAEQSYAKAGKKLQIARMYEDAGELSKAASYYRDIQKWDRAAELFERLGRTGEATELFEKLYFLAASGLRERATLQAKEEAEELEAKVASLRRAAGDLDKLFDFYLRAGLFVKAAELAVETGHSDKAVELYLRAGKEDAAAQILDARGESLRASRLRGDLAARRGELFSAARHYEAAGDLRLAAECYERLGEEERAAELYERSGDYGQAAFLYARLKRYDRAAEFYEAAGDLDAALRCYETLGEGAKRAALLAKAGRFLRAGQAYRELGRPDDAIAALQKLDLDGKEGPAALALLGLVFWEKGMFDLALEKLDAAIASGGASSAVAPAVEVRYARARCLEALGDAESAIAEYHRVIAIDFDYRDATERLEALKTLGTSRTDAEARGKTSRATAGEAGAAARPSPPRPPVQAALATPPPRPGETTPESPLRSATLPAAAGERTKLDRGRYRILEEVGRGGMGIVYKCEDTLLGRIVAYKVLSSQIRDFPAAFENFLREAKSAARLNHPNIVTLYDFGEADGNYFMTLEYVSGKNLRQFMKTRPEPETVRRVLLGMCEGLAYAHSQNVLHRDIKPSNILISEIDEKAKILDFGLAKVMEDVSQTASGVLGTPWYMSPEQVLGTTIDRRTDIYSLGVTLFEVMTGELPFRGRDFGYHHVHTPPPSPRSVNPSVSEDLDKIILKCMQKKPEDRFQSADEVREAIERARL